MSEMWEAGHQAGIVWNKEVRQVEITVEEGEDRTEQQGFVEDS